MYAKLKAHHMLPQFTCVYSDHFTINAEISQILALIYLLMSVADISLLYRILLVLAKC